MNFLIAAALFFVGLNILISGTALRGVLVRRLGEKTGREMAALRRRDIGVAVHGHPHRAVTAWR